MISCKCVCVFLAPVLWFSVVLPMTMEASPLSVTDLIKRYKGRKNNKVFQDEIPKNAEFDAKFKSLSSMMKEKHNRNLVNELIR